MLVSQSAIFFFIRSNDSSIDEFIIIDEYTTGTDSGHGRWLEFKVVN